MSSHLDQASSAGKTEIVEVKCVIVSGFQRTEHLSFDDWEECKRRRLPKCVTEKSNAKKQTLPARGRVCFLGEPRIGS